MARPTRFEADARRREFVANVANGERLDLAARKAGLDPWRALRMADEPEMLDLLAAVKPGHWTTLREELHAIREREAAAVHVGEAPEDRGAVGTQVRQPDGCSCGAARPVQA